MDKAKALFKLQVIIYFVRTQNFFEKLIFLSPDTHTYVFITYAKFFEKLIFFPLVPTHTYL